MGQNPRCPGYNRGENQGDKLKYYLQRLFLSSPSLHSLQCMRKVRRPPSLGTTNTVLCVHHRRCCTTSIQYLPVNRAVAYPYGTSCIRCRPYDVGHDVVYDAGPALLQYWVCCIRSGSTSANTCHLPNTISINNTRHPSFHKLEHKHYSAGPKNQLR